MFLQGRDPTVDVGKDEVDLGIGFDLAASPGTETVFDIPVVVGLSCSWVIRWPAAR